MALPNLSGSNIQDTFQRVLHTDGNLVHDGTGSLLPIAFGSGNISSSGNVYAADYFDDGVNINTIYQPALTFGIAETNVFRASASVADNDFLRVNGTVIEGLSAAQVGAVVAAGVIAEIGDGDLTIAMVDELQAFHSDTQTALAGKAPKTNATFTGSYFNVQPSITASGDISASGDLYFNKIDGGTF